MHHRRLVRVLLLSLALIPLFGACSGREVAPSGATCRRRVPTEAVPVGGLEAVQMVYARCEPWFAELCGAMESYAEVTETPVLDAVVNGPGPDWAADVRDAVGADRLRRSHDALLAPLARAEGSVAQDLEVVIRALPDGTPDDRAEVVPPSRRVARRWAATLDACAA